MIFQIPLYSIKTSKSLSWLNHGTNFHHPPIKQGNFKISPWKMSENFYGKMEEWDKKSYQLRNCKNISPLGSINQIYIQGKCLKKYVVKVYWVSTFLFKKNCGKSAIFFLSIFGKIFHEIKITCWIQPFNFYSKYITIDENIRLIFLQKFLYPSYFLECWKRVVSVGENWAKNKYKDTFYTILFYMCVFCESLVSIFTNTNNTFQTF